MGIVQRMQSVVVLFFFCILGIVVGFRRSGLNRQALPRGARQVGTGLFSEAFKKRASDTIGELRDNDFGVYMPSAMTAVGDEDFEEKVLSSEELNVVFFTSSWCAPCATMMTLLTTEIMAKHGTKANFFVCDTDLNPELTSEYNVRSIPSTLLIKDSTVVSDIVGAVEDANVVSEQIIKFF